MRTEREAQGAGQPAKVGIAPPTPPLTRRIAEAGRRTTGRVLGPKQHDTPAPPLPAPDQADVVAASRTWTPVRAVVAGAGLVALGWWRSRHWRRRGGSSEDAQDD